MLHLDTRPPRSAHYDEPLFEVWWRPVEHNCKALAACAGERIPTSHRPLSARQVKAACAAIRPEEHASVRLYNQTGDPRAEGRVDIYVKAA